MAIETGIDLPVTEEVIMHHVRQQRPKLFFITALLAALTAQTRTSEANFALVATTSAANTHIYRVGDTKDRANAPAAAATHRTGYPIVVGFGIAIPLKTALPLIIPSYVKVHFGAGVNQSMPCSWHPGLPWPATLAIALAPLGLHLSATPTTAKITIKKIS